jgi:hypothetical protein
MDSPLQHERRSRQRFDFQIPATLRVNGSDRDEPAFTQDLSARGAFLYTDCVVAEGAGVELTLMMPAEITLAESMPVRCRAKVLRVMHREAVKHKIGVAVELLGYEYLAQRREDAKNSTDFERISTLHAHPFGDDESAIPMRRN